MYFCRLRAVFCCQTPQTPHLENMKILQNPEIVIFMPHADPTWVQSDACHATFTMYFCGLRVRLFCKTPQSGRIGMWHENDNIKRCLRSLTTESGLQSTKIHCKSGTATACSTLHSGRIGMWHENDDFKRCLRSLTIESGSQSAKMHCKSGMACGLCSPKTHLSSSKYLLI